MLRFAALSLALGTSGCFGLQSASSPDRCDQPVPWAAEPTPAYEARSPTPARPTSLPARHLSVKPGLPDLSAIATATFERATAPRDAESLAGWLLSCRARSEGQVATDVFTGPDLLVYATLGERRYPGQLGAALVYADPLRTGEAMRFLLNDHDFFSPNDYVGEARGTYAGRVPFRVAGRNANVECRGLPPELVGERIASTKRAVGKQLLAMESFQGTLEVPLPAQHATALGALLAEVVFYEGSASTYPAEVESRVEQLSSAQWAKHQARIASLAQRLPAPGTWVRVNEALEARTRGLACAPNVSCRIDLELRVVPAAAPLGLCDFERSALQRLTAYAWTGDTAYAEVESMALAGLTVKHRSQLAELPAGSVIRVRVAVAPDRGLRRAEAWDLPLLGIGQAVLRVH